MMRRYPETFELALTADDVERIFKKGKIASLIGMEGGHSIDNSLAALRMFHRLGRALHDADPLEEHARGPTLRPTTRSSEGLSPFGEEIVREMNRLGMLVDLSHVSPDTMDDAIRVSQAPVIFSHSSARGRERRPAQRAGRHPAAAPEERRRRHGDVRAGVPVAEGRGVEQAADRRTDAADRAVPRTTRPP